MSRMYTDYVNKTALTVPDKFIDVKTGDTYSVSPQIEAQIEYHAKNNTLIHLVLSALNQYLLPKAAINGDGNAQILNELFEIKRMMREGYIPVQNMSMNHLGNHQQLSSASLDMKELEDVLEAFGG